MSKYADKCLPFFNILKKNKGFDWTPECQQAFEQLKAYLSSPPVLSRPAAVEDLLLYISVTDHSVAAALIREEARIQRPIYYVSKVLNGPESRYHKVEKAALAVVTAARKLRPYFQAHKIIIPTDFPLKQTLQKPDVSGRLIKWSIELGEYDLEFRTRSAIKSQALADFIAEGYNVSEVPPPQTLPLWTIYIDGASSKQACGAGIILEGPEGYQAEYALRFQFKASNNMAEYEALVTGLKLAKEVGA
ncbi:hypothetical protein L2V44_14130, partial [Staphylococcus aureus]|nr:hypothetical protein [Staphylococcus aureus]